MPCPSFSKFLFSGLLAAVFTMSPAVFSRCVAQDDSAAIATEDDFYRIIRFAIPEELNVEASAVEVIKSESSATDRLAVATRRGDIFLVDGAFEDDPAKVTFTLFAQGLHEVLGLHENDGWLYATQRCDVTRLKDTDGDDKADKFEVFCDGWEISGDYHEYAFGSNFDDEGNMWVTLCLTGSFGSDVKYRGWCLRIDEDGNVIPTCGGIRSPGGIGFNSKGDVFYTDNQGPWNGTCSLKWLRPGSFQGHPGGNKWYELATEAMGAAPTEPNSGSRMMTEAARIAEYEPPCILFPYKKMGQSASGFACDQTEGKFGPFKGQLFVGDVTHSLVMRCFLEEVNGHYQGACFPFRSDLGSGTLALKFGSDGSLIAGGTNRGWGSRGTKSFAVERLQWTGKMPFEIKTMEAKPDGFRFTFTEPVDRQAAAKPDSWKWQTYTYIFQSSYGSPEVDYTKPEVADIQVSEDGLTVDVTLNEMQIGHVHEVIASGLKSVSGHSLLHPEAYYTLNYLPATSEE